MKVNLLLRYSDFRGDHAADCALAMDVIPGETVDALMARARWLRGTVEVVEVRIVEEAVAPVPAAGGGE